LGKEVGAKEDFASVGAAIGMGRLLMLVQSVENKLSIPQAPALHVILPFEKAQQPLALMLAATLQAKGLSTDVLLEGGSITNMMKKANKMGAKYVLLLGADEQKNGTVSIKNMIKGETVVVKQAEAANAVV
jgi:histidyl-tRNA synthetase